MYRWSRLNVCNNFLLSLLHHTDPMCVVKDLHHYFHNKVIKFPDLVCVYDVSKLFFLVHIYFPYNICLTLAAKRAKGKGKKKTITRHFQFCLSWWAKTCHYFFNHSDHDFKNFKSKDLHPTPQAATVKRINPFKVSLHY